MTTARELITDAYIDLGRHDPAQTLPAKLSSYGLRVLNRMIGEWSNENLLIPFTVTENFSLTSGQASYTMGTGGTASTTRAIALLDCYIKDSNGYSYPQEIIDQRKYNQILNKSLGGRPDSVFYDPVYPIGVLYFYKVPGSSYTAYIESRKILNTTLAIGTTITLDVTYENAIVFNLRNNLAGKHTQVTPFMVKQAEDALNKIKVVNASNRLEEMDLPAGVGGQSVGTIPRSINDG